MTLDPLSSIVLNYMDGKSDLNDSVYNDSADIDAFFMRLAIKISRTGQGQIDGIRPSVGCVIIDPKTHNIISYGRTGNTGHPHAETAAIEQAIAEDKKASLAGATAYVTLEPCAHTTPRKPVCCAQNLVRHGIKRVVVSCDDPFGQVNGAGYTILEEAGIEVTRTILACEAKPILQDFLTTITHQRPFITLKMAVSAEGMVGLKGEGKARITEDIAQKHAHVTLRQFRKAIMVGIGTALHDNPTLTTRLDGQDIHNTRIILDPKLALPHHSNLVKSVSAGHPLFLVYDRATPIPPYFQDTEGITVVAVDDTHNLPDVLGTLASDQYGITSILVEGGARLIQSFVHARLWDELYLYQSPIEIGTKNAVPAPVFGQNILVEAKQLGADRLEIYRPFTDRLD